MDTIRLGRRTLTALTVSLSAAMACLASLGCSSNGSAFDTGMAGSGSSNPVGTTGGSGSDPTNASGGDTSSPTQVMGGSAATTGGVSNAGSSAGGSGNSGGNPPQAGSDAGGGSGNTGGADTGPTCPKPAGQLCHEFIANDNGKNQVNYVNEFTGAKWSTPVGSTGANSPRTIEIVDNAKAAGGKAVWSASTPATSRSICRTAPSCSRSRPRTRPT